MKFFWSPVKKISNFETKTALFRYFAHNFFKNVPFCFFTYVLEKNTKKLFKVFFYLRLLSLKIIILFLKLYVLFDFFDIFFLIFYKFEDRVDSGPMIITIFFFQFLILIFFKQTKTLIIYFKHLLIIKINSK